MSAGIYLKKLESPLLEKHSFQRLKIGQILTDVEVRL